MSERSADLYDAAERAWMRQAPPSRGVADGQPLPYGALDHDGQLVGMTVDMLDKIRTRTGLTFQFVRADLSVSWQSHAVRRHRPHRRHLPAGG